MPLFYRLVCNDKVSRQAKMSFSHMILHTWRSWVKEWSIYETWYNKFTFFPILVSPEYDMDQHCQYPFWNVKYLLPVLSVFYGQNMKLRAPYMAEKDTMHVSKPVITDFFCWFRLSQEHLFNFLLCSDALPFWNFKKIEICFWKKFVINPYALPKRHWLVFKDRRLLCDQNQFHS